MAGRKRRDDSPFRDASRLLAALLADARRARGITQEQLAADAGVSLSTLRKIERGRTIEPGYFTVAVLAKRLGLPLAQLEDLPQTATRRRARR